MMGLIFAGFEVTSPVVLLGAVTGMTYGILAVGLVLIYRSSRIVNFAHGEIGAFGAALLGLAVTRWRVPYWIAFLLALTGAAAVGALGEVAIVRRLRRAPSLMSIVATLGFAQFLIFFSSAFNAQATAGQAYPQPSWLPEFDVGPLRVTPSYSGMLFVTPLLVLALALFLKRSRTGLAIRASANNQDAARLSAVFASRMSTLTWSIAGAVSAFTAIMVLPTRGFTSQQFLGPGLLLRALAAAVIARMVSLPAALAAGIGIGILEQLLLWNSPSGGLVEAMLFVVILVALLLQRRSGVREEERGGWTAVQPWLPLPDRLREIRSIRNLGRMVAGGGFAVALVMTLFITNATAIILVAIAAFGMVGLSLGIVTGLGGQLSLGQFALAGVGATASFAVATRTGNFFLAFACAGLVAGAVSLVIGVPSLRIRGLMLAVTTLGFALAAESWLFRQGWTLGDGADPGRPIIGSIAIDTGKKYYLFSLAVLAGGLWISRNVWRGGIGLRLRALRDNEDGARAFTIPVTRVKLQAFVLGGFLAGIAGATYGHALSFLSGLAFPISASIDVAAMTVLGGIGILTGPIIGALYIIGVPRFIDLDSAGLAATALGWLILIMYFPGGIAQLLAAVRGRIIGFLARRVGADPEAPGSEEFPTAAPDLPVGARLIPPAERNDGEVLLEVRDLTKHYGGVRAVDGVDLTVRPGETLGIIGPNGAGKTTLFELIGGFVRPDSGRVLFASHDVTRLGPERRGQLGLIRSFQDARLFPTLTVLESVALALERADPTWFLRSVLGGHAAERRKKERAREIIGMMGLDGYRSRQISELSTGTRRIAELACLVALEPTLLLLDEPSSGIAQAETEELGTLLVRLREFLGVTLVVIEHDVPLIMGISDRVVAMESGRIIADGPPEVVRHDPQVVESYIGGDVRSVLRSGVGAGELEGRVAAGGRCTVVTRAGSRCSRAAGPDGRCVQHRRQAVSAGSAK